MGGGPVHSFPYVIGQASALLLGFPNRDLWYLVAFLFVAAIIISGVMQLYRASDSRWIFYASATIFAPGALVLLAQPVYLHFRYFIICFPFFLLLVVRLARKWYDILRKGKRFLVLVSIALLIAGHIPKIHALLTLRRGQYTAALEYIAGSAPLRIIRIGTDQDFRNGMIFRFYVPRIKGGERLRYIEQNRWGAEPPDWIVLHSFDTHFRPVSGLSVGMHHYTLERQYRHADMSGWSWFLFKRVAD